MQRYEKISIPCNTKYQKMKNIFDFRFFAALRMTGKRLGMTGRRLGITGRRGPERAMTIRVRGG
jgi:hypothetical protein